MKKLQVSTLAEMAAAMPHFIEYRPPRESVVLLGMDQPPTVCLAPKLMQHAFESFESVVELAQELTIFQDRKVAVLHVDGGYWEEITVLLQLAGVTPAVEMDLPYEEVLVAYGEAPTREEYLAANADKMEQNRKRAEGLRKGRKLATGDTDE